MQVQLRRPTVRAKSISCGWDAQMKIWFEANYCKCKFWAEIMFYSYIFRWMQTCVNEHIENK